jgi:hypothetical protein
MALLNCFWYIQLVFNLFLGPWSCLPIY